MLVANVTDINDKIYDAARAAGRPSDELAREMTAHYVADTDRLGLGRPDHEPLATEMVDEIEALIAELLERGHAYAVDGDVYFRVRSLPEYGELSHRDVDEMDQGEGVEGAERKEDPLDFALWKAQKPFEDTAWDAPWGRGRPGWHIECSAMAEALLGVEFEVHGGGIDLVFPHHENEAAQTLAARGRPLARIWMHNGMVELGGGRRRGEDVQVARQHPRPRRGARRGRPRRARHVLLRGPLPPAARLLARALRRRRAAASSGSATPAAASSPATRRPALAPHREAFFAALADDFNTPRALAALSEWIREANKVAGVGRRATCARCSACSASPTCWSAARARRPRSSRWPSSAPRRAPGATSPRPTASATSCRPAGWVVRDGPAGPELVPAGP